MPISVTINEIINYFFLPFVASVAATLLFSVIIPYISKKTSYRYKLINTLKFLKILTYLLILFIITAASIFPIIRFILFLYNYLFTWLKLFCILVISIILFIEYKILFNLYFILNKISSITNEKFLLTLRVLMIFWNLLLWLGIISDVVSNTKIEKYYSTDSIKLYFFILFSFLLTINAITRNKIRYKIFISNSKMPINIIDGESSLCNSHKNYVIIYYFNKFKGITHRQIINRDQITFLMQYY